MRFRARRSVLLALRSASRNFQDVRTNACCDRSTNRSATDRGDSMTTVPSLAGTTMRATRAHSVTGTVKIGPRIVSASRLRRPCAGQSASSATATAHRKRRLRLPPPAPPPPPPAGQAQWPPPATAAPQAQWPAPGGGRRDDPRAPIVIVAAIAVVVALVVAAFFGYKFFFGAGSDEDQIKVARRNFHHRLQQRRRPGDRVVMCGGGTKVVPLQGLSLRRLPARRCGANSTRTEPLRLRWPISMSRGTVLRPR